MERAPLVIVGLGNPGTRYVETRHNAGFLVVEAFARDAGLSFKEESRFLCEIASGRVGEQRIILVKPQTFMNLSGASVAKVVNYYRTPIENLLIISDDADIPFGQLRLREGGSCGGQNGLRSVEESLQTESYPRLRFGIGKSSSVPLDAYVLMRFEDVQWAEVPQISARAVEIIKIWAREGMAKAQKKAALNQSKAPKEIEG